MASLRFSKIRPKLKKNLTDPNFGMMVTTIQLHHCARFGMNLLNNVQNFPSKHKKTAKYG